MGLAEHRALAPRPGEAQWFMPTGEIDVAADATAAAALARKVERPARPRLRGRTSDRRAARRARTRNPPAAGRGARPFYAEEGWVDVSRMIAAILARLR